MLRYFDQYPGNKQILKIIFLSYHLVLIKESGLLVHSGHSHPHILELGFNIIGFVQAIRRNPPSL